MKNSGKKILSVIMAVAMLATMIPTFALTAFADAAPSGNKSEYSYFVKDTTSGIASSANLSWDGSANFESGSYAKLSDTPLSAVSEGSGFIVSYDYVAGDLGADTWIMNFTGGSNRMSFINGSNDWWMRPAVEISNGSKTRVYEGDFTKNAYLSTTHSDNGNGCCWWKTLRMTYVFNTDGSLDLTVLNLNDTSDSFTVTYRSDYGSLDQGHGMTDAEVYAAVSSLTDYFVGAGDNSPNHDYTGHVKNVRIFATAEAKALQLAMINYENKMAQGKIYKNMSAAYNAYVAANKGFDAYIYGGDTSVNIDSLASTLETATNNMTEWTKPTANAVQSYQANASDNGVDRAASNSVNILSANRNSTSGQTTAASQEIANCSTKIYYGETVLLYDGETQPRFPVAFSCVRTSNKTRYVHTMYPASSDGSKSSSANASTDFDLHHDKGEGHDNCWYGSDTNNNRIDYTYNYTLSEKVGGNSTNSDNHWSAYLNNSTTHYYVSACRYIGTPNTAILDFAIKWSQRSSSNEQVSGSSITNDDYGTMTSSVHTYVYNYAGIKNRIESKINYDVTKYTQGGLSGLFTYSDVLTRDWSALLSDQSQSNAAYNAISATSVTADTDAYNTMRSYLTNGLNTKSLGALGSNLTASQIYNDAAINNTNVANYDRFAAAYEDAVAHMAALKSNNYGHTATSTGKTAAQINSELNTAYGLLERKSGSAVPTITQASGLSALGIGDEITIASSETTASGSVTYKVFYDVDSAEGDADVTNTFAYGTSTNVALFTDNSHNKAIVTAIGIDSDGAATNAATSTFYRLMPATLTGMYNPSLVDIPADGIVDKDTIVQAAKTSTNSDSSITIQYSYNGGEDWIDDNDGGQIYAFPVSEGKYPSVSAISLRTVIKSGGSVIAHSDVATTTLARQADFGIYIENAGSTATSYDANDTNKDKIIIYDTANYSDDIVFTLTADGAAVSGTGEDTAGVFTYDKVNGIDLTDNSALAQAINDARVITINAYSKDVKSGDFNTYATATFYCNANMLIYHESFNGSVSNGTYTTNDAKGVNITAGGTGTIAVAPDAGDKQGVSQGETGSSADIRKNSLKISGNSSGEAYAKLASNPFAANDAVKAISKENGVTISFWRALHSQNSDNRTNAPTGNLKRDAIAFRRTSGGSESGEIAGYYMIELTGNTSYTKTFDDYFDMQPSEYDQTQYVPSKYSGYWQHVAVTINPKAATVEEAITIYLNGIPHDNASIISASGGEYAAASDTVAKTIGDMLDMITDSGTYVCLAHDNTWQSFTDDVYLDDIRFYSKALTQKEVWNGYYDSYSDTPTVEGHLASVTHDPTTITVYKLKSATNGVAAGSLVGQEFVDYYNVPSSNYTIEYYSYGTGMQIYHSYDSVNWEIVCDSEGRVAYQNRDEFVRDNGNGTFTPMYYRDALDEVCDAVYDMASSGQKAYAGNLIWAPHVSYNLEANKWMMYVSVSFWGDAKSAIIALESFDGTPVHFLARTSSNTQAYNVLTKSNGRPNSIDPCTFYGHNADGTINRYALYMTYGAWSEGGGLNKDLCIIQLTTDGKKTNNNSSNYPVTFTNATWASSGTYICSSQPNDPNTCTGEGSFVIYHDGYYYLYTAFGVNDYNYVTRIFRSTSPTGPYVDYNGVNATSTSQIHGTQIMAPHYMVNDDYIYLSTGHDSVYKAVNNYGETVLIHSAHGRPVSNKANLDNGNYRATPDVAMITRQKDFLGNITITHPMYFTQTGWTISMPEQYNGTDTSKNIKASQIDGTYSASTLHDIIDENLSYSSKVKPSGYSDNWDFSQKLYFSHETDTTGVIYGDGQNGFMNLDYTYELSYDTENPEDSTTTYITVYNGSTEVAEGVVAMHDGVPELSYFNITEVDLNTGTPTRASSTVWSVKSGDLPEGADFTNLDEDYNRGDAMLKELSTEAPKYTKSSVDALITAVDAAKANSTKSDAKKRITPVSEQNAIDNQEDAIEEAIANLEVAPAAVNESVMETYIEVIQKVENIINNIDSDIYDSSAFTQESITTTVSVVVSESESEYGSYIINTIDNSATNEKIETATAETLEFISNNYKRYKIYIEDGEDVSCANDGKLVGSIEAVSGQEYQYIATANSRAVFRTDIWNSAWYMSYQSTGASRSKQYQGFGYEVALPVVGDMHVYAVQENADKPNRVTIERVYSDNQESHAIQFVEFVNGSFELPQAPAIPFYTFSGYTYGGNSYSAGDTISEIDGDIEVNANYTKASSNAYAVKVSSVGENGDVYNDSAEFNQKITAVDSSAYAWTETVGTTTRIFSFGSELSFFVTESATIQAITKAEYEAAGYAAPKVNLRSIGVEITNAGTKNKILFNGNIAIFDEEDIVECGILFGKATTGTITDSDLVLQKTGTQEGYKVLRAKSTKLVGANQFSISVSTATTGEFKYRGYVIYQNEDNELVTVYSNVVDASV